MDGSFQELKCLYTNLQSLHSKRKEIELYLQENKVDLMFFTECWITEDHHVSEYSFDGFQTVVCKKHRGAPFIYIRDYISYCYRFNYRNINKIKFSELMNDFDCH